MAQSLKHIRNPAETRQRLVGATLGLMLRQGYAATTVDQICAEAGLTKGSFFHYFANKEAIARAALDAFAQMGTDLYTPAWSEPGVDPLEQLHRLLDIMVSFNQRPDELCVCMVGMMSQELSQVNAEMRTACDGHLQDWEARVTHMLTEAKKIHRVRRAFEPAQVAHFLNSLWQGSMLVGKTRQSPELVIQNIELARDFVDSLFESPSPRLGIWKGRIKKQKSLS
ncbi:TetR/AcrR family transcriptional regulator [Prosthecobacter dejongeii]|uniref:TetR/AcrR family transcriptional repressor of nem operon n=1 Tax=Prosthecobacter dejongeii TaxID=48465 RepID=A0A7W7YIX2_9BACT|nr:TetR/AcrR family transcriptional regulator [Prosthecobacter dejongeii]MBB5037051.1 TetR/AcrR family transcriptional repressor of nem operon [Prosthecobacter dejongeii]